MKADTTITITPTVIQDWERRADDCERQASKLQEEAKSYRARAQAGRLLLGLAGDIGASDRDVGSDRDGTQNMTAAIRNMANESPEPLTKKEIKSRLLAADYPASRLGAYFYTPIHRLKAAKQITVLPDGRIWRASA
jgi:hypothetical protein